MSETIKYNPWAEPGAAAMRAFNRQHKPVAGPRRRKRAKKYGIVR